MHPDTAVLLELLVVDVGSAIPSRAIRMAPWNTCLRAVICMLAWHVCLEMGTPDVKSPLLFVIINSCGSLASLFRKKTTVGFYAVLSASYNICVSLC